MLLLLVSTDWHSDYINVEKRWKANINKNVSSGAKAALFEEYVFHIKQSFREDCMGNDDTYIELEDDSIKSIDLELRQHIKEAHQASLSSKRLRMLATLIDNNR